MARRADLKRPNQDQKRKKVVLIDGHSLFHRAFYALPYLTNSQGQPTNAVYGFLTMLLKLIDEEKPLCIATALDRSLPTFRHVAYERYKAHRPQMADELRSQVPYLRRALDALRVSVYELDGYEADDVIGTLANQAAQQGYDVLVVTGDRDLLQVVRPGIEVLLTRKGISDMERYDEEAVRARYGIEPSQLPDVKALMGDPSDNIPGVPGVGEKTAARLIKRFGSLDAILSQREGVRDERFISSILANREQVLMSRALATIVTDAPVEFDPDACLLRDPDRVALRELCDELDFKSLARRLGLEKAPQALPETGGNGHVSGAGARGTASGADQAGWRLVRTAIEADEVLGEMRRRIQGGDEISILPALEPVGGQPGMMALRSVAVQCGSLPPHVFIDDGLASVRQLLAEPGVRIAGHDLKPFLRLLIGEQTAQRLSGTGQPRLSFDTSVACYLLDPLRSGYPLDDMTEKYLGVAAGRLTAGVGGTALLAQRVTWLRPLRKRLDEGLASYGLTRLYQEVELPLVSVLAEMEAWGVAVDPAVLDDLGEEFVNRIEALTKEIYELAGTEFNINSPLQLSDILFGKLGLPPVRKTKTGLSTDASVLAKLAPLHPIVPLILEHRQLVKLKGTYIDGLKPLINPVTGRVHTTFNQTVTATGRLSSTDPNLQNIPVRDEIGRRIRRAFVAAPGCVLVSADYSQIELRLLAHISGDSGLIAAFKEGADIHQATAAEVFGVPRDQVTPAMRSRAKAVNFGIVYGISDYGLSENLGITRGEAKEFIENYFRRYPGVRQYCERIVNEARRDGFVRTIMGRIRQLPEINSRNYARRQFAERTALNTPIQGSAADIIKKAMVDVHRGMKDAAPRARLILQVHDELILEVPEEEAASARDYLAKKMEGVMELAVPLKVDVRSGRNWYDME